jgi:beta-glucosidase
MRGNIMNFKKNTGLLLLLLLLTVISANNYVQASENETTIMLTDEASIPNIISKMTIDEKCQLVCGIGLMTPYGSAGATYAIPRLKIPSIELADGPQGVRMGGLTITPNYVPAKYATCFPNPLLNASTWNRSLINRIGVAMAEECQDYGADVLLSPAMNIIKNPLGGRTFEYYSEDPYLIGILSTEAVKGIQLKGIGACIKHYICNNQENNRIDGNEIISERTLRELYLLQYEMTVKNADPWTAMAAYNKVNGTRMTENKYLLQDILRDEFGFNGMIMSDWGAYNQAEAFAAGLDLNEPGGFYNMAGIIFPAWLLQIKPAVTSWNAIKESDLDRAINNILKLVIKSPTFKGTYGNKEQFKNKTTLSAAVSEKNSILAESIVEEGAVLLKNEDSTLPIDTGKVISVSGKNAFDDCGIIYEGNGSATVNVKSEDVVSLIQGLKNGGFNVVSTVNNKIIVENISAANAQKLAFGTDVGIISIGLPGHEGSDYKSMSLSKNQTSLIETIGNAYHAQNKKTVVILNTAAPVEVKSWVQYADAIIWVGLPGSTGANAIGNIINGTVNPSGKLTVTWPAQYSDVVDSDYFPKNANSTIEYKEGIYVGYRHYDKNNITPAYRFGYGLSYTTFEYSNLRLSADNFDLNNCNLTLTVSVNIKNTGRTAGKETAQLYIQDIEASKDRPKKELKGFGKTQLLNPGETQTLEFTINKQNLSFFNENSGDWIAEPGAFKVIIGGTSDSSILHSEGKGVEVVFEAN